VGAAFQFLIADVHSAKGEQQFLLDGVNGVDGQNQRLVLQHRRHVQAVDRHLEEKKWLINLKTNVAFTKQFIPILRSFFPPDINDLNELILITLLTTHSASK